MNPDVISRLSGHLVPHPRLLLPAGAEAELNRRCTSDSRLAKLRAVVLDDAAHVLTLAPLQRVLTGRRLLSVSRDGLHRLGTLTTAYRLTGDRRFAVAGRDTLLTLSAFSDFHPEHFLDTAEIAAGMAVGYDGLFDNLSPDDRATIRLAMIQKALTLDLSKQWWFHGTNNWTQVCHGGLAMAALAIAEDEPGLAAKTVSSAVDNVPGSMKAYAPDGAYPEGPTYWGYGTTYNVMLIASLQSALGDDFGLLQRPGFLKSADFHLQSVSPAGVYFAYCDCSISPDSLVPAAFFMARQRQQPWLLYNELRQIDRLKTPTPGKPGEYGSNSNWLALLLAGELPLAVHPAETRFVAGGVTPVAMFRTGWTPDATYLGIKAGSPGSNHAHMDVGAFAIDYGGVRWASDLGMQDYDSLERKGLQIWDMAPDSQRWTVFRLGPMSHSILTVDGRDQDVHGRADWVHTGNDFATLDMGKVYSGQLAAACRGVMLNTNGSVRVQDEITAPARAVTVRWAVLVPVDATLNGSSAVLKKAGKTLNLRVISPANTMLNIVATNPPPNSFDAPNPGTQLVTFDVPLSPGESKTLVVDIMPADINEPVAPIRPLAMW